ncbi:RecQ family ATP-dependent DNA helicase [candidate division KSB1 bacterium]|nr:RecQ family ATP-dependent DNA helicase [candidate division KSB1 bacterium]
MPLNLKQELHRHFGFDAFRPGQDAAINHVLNKNDALVVMPTGAGKSLCYQLPALLTKGTTLVVSPLIALMKDQVETLQASGKAAAFINSSLSTSEQSERIRDMREGRFQLIYVAPERFRSSVFLSALAEVEVSLFVVDEAHCISHWGHDFRPDYLNLKNVISSLDNPTVTALTATATVKVQEDIIQQLGLLNCKKIVTGFNRPNLSFEVEYTLDDNAKRFELEKLLKKQPGSTIIYTGRRREAEEVAEFVRIICKQKTDFYHAGLSAESRSRIQDAFMNNETSVIVATNAFGMGVDKPDIRRVIHYTLPGTLEAYYQEAGRAGRDGEPSRVILLYSPDDQGLQKWFIENSLPTRKELTQIYDVLKGFAEDNLIRINMGYLERATDLYETKIRVGIAELLKAKVMQDLGDRNQTLNFKLLPIQRLDLSTNVREIEKRRRYRHQQLDQMIGYADSSRCRRRFILEHFGDKGAPDAERCCDVCLRKSSISAKKPAADGEYSEVEKTALIILHAVKHFKREVGRSRLVEVLTGSRGKEIFAFGWHKVKHYGRLQHYTQAQCKDFVDQLLKERYLKLIWKDYPLLKLTLEGEEALQKLTPIPLDPKDASVPALSGSSSRWLSGVSSTDQVTLALFRKGLSAGGIAEQRNLSARTIFTHLSHLIESDLVKVVAVVSADKVKGIRSAIKVAGMPALKPIKEILSDNYSYDEIKCVVADEMRRGKGLKDNVSAEYF